MLLVGCAGIAVAALLGAVIAGLLLLGPWQGGGSDDGPSPPPDGTLEILSPVDRVTVYVDDREMGTAPVRVDLPPGRYTVRVARPGCDEASRTVEVFASSRSELVLEPDCPSRRAARHEPPARSSPARGTGPGSLGISGRPVDREVQQAFGLSVAEGTLVDQVGPGSGDLAPGDVIVGVDGRRIPSFDQLAALVEGTAPGTELRLDVLRNGRRLTIPVVVQSRRVGLIIPGLEVSDRPADRRAHGSDAVSGVTVVAVAPDSPPDAAGLAVGDVIQTVGSTPVTSADGLAAALWAAQQPGRSVALGVYRPRTGELFQVEVFF